MTVIIAECARYAGHEPRVVHRAKRAVELLLEAAIHASDDVIHERHAGFLCRCPILPREVLDDVLHLGFSDGPRFALLLDRHLDLLLHFDRVDLGRPFVQRPQVVIDADLGHAFIGRFDWAHAWLVLIVHQGRRKDGRELHACFGRLWNTSVGHDGLDGGHLGRTGEGEDRFGRVCIASQRPASGYGRRHDGRLGWCRPAVTDRRCGILDLGRTEGAEPGRAPTGEGDRSAQYGQDSKTRGCHNSRPRSRPRLSDVAPRIPLAQYKAGPRRSAW